MEHPCVPGAVLGLGDPAQRATGTWHLVRAAADPEGLSKTDLGVVAVRTFLQRLPRLGLLGFQVVRGDGAGRCGKERPEHRGGHSALGASFPRRWVPGQTPQGTRCPLHAQTALPA